MSDRIYKAIAHLAEDGREHRLGDHLAEVGQLAREFSAPWRAGDYGEIAGRLHDLGKYAADFQSYIRDASRSQLDRRDAHIEPGEGPTARASGRGRVDHSSAGALAARELYGPLGELLAFVIAGHHAGLANRPDLRSRLNRQASRLDAARAGNPPEDPLLGRRLDPPFDLRAPSAIEAPAVARRLEIWVRMLFSALCDADFLDTEAFFDPKLASDRGAGGDAILEKLLRQLTTHVDRLQDDAEPSEVNLVRRAVREAAVTSSAAPPGVFTLTVPTGGGKTLAGMEFALHHARTHGLRRVIVAIPYTSIIEQNAAVYREAFGDDNGVLEHHSSFDAVRETARSRLAAQNWDAPIVVTTTVQLFESLFARRTSRCRKLHNLARSVIVLDEAQTMPPRLLEPTLEVLATMVNDYGVSLVVSTATQPAFGRVSLGRFGFDTMREIVPDEVRAFERLRRVDVIWPKDPEPAPYSQIADELARYPNVLVITHRRADARKLTELVDARIGNDRCLHLSALMCPDHRSRVLEGIKGRKLRGEAIRLVSTQLVEAGVDLDFPLVYRAFAGLDSLAQAAGRCNREGRLSRGELRVFRAETTPPPGVLRTGKAIAEGMLSADPGLDLFSSEPYHTYFARLYGATNTDDRDIQAARSELMFEDTARMYRLIEDDWSRPVVVPYGRAGHLIDQLTRMGPSRDRLRALGRFSVNVAARLVRDWLIRGDALLDDESGVVCLAQHVDAYDDRFGLLPERVSAGMDVEALIVDG